MKPTVSVILPIRNEARYISRCLESIVRQSYPAEQIEILVVDGLSDDGTREIVAGWTQRDPRIQLLDNPYKTVPYAMNMGIFAQRR